MKEQDYLRQLQHLRHQHWPADAPTAPWYPLGEKPMTEYLRYWAITNPSKVAIEFYGHSTTFAELDEQSDRFANVLIALGITPGDRVAVFMPNCPQFNIAYWGIMKAGAVHVPVSPLSQTLELRHELEDSGANAILCFDQLLSVTQPVCAELGIKHIFITSYSELKPEHPTLELPDVFDHPKIDSTAGLTDFFTALRAASAEPPAHKPELDDIAALNYTGGTTGLPKGCVHTHRNILHTMASYCPVVFGAKTTASDAIQLSFLPQFWIAGENTGLLMSIFEGATLVLLARWDPLAFMQAVQRYQVSGVFMLVDSMDEVLNHPSLPDYDLTSLDTTASVSFIKKINKDYRRRWQAVSGCTMFEAAYGMTETHTCDTFTRGFQDDDFDLGFDPNFVGLPVPTCDIKITDFETGQLMPIGQEGEINLKTPSLFKGYWNKPEVNAEVIKDGWFKTGDRGVISEDGFLRYLGRRKEMLKVNGMSVFPTELEFILARNTDIAACGVVGREDERKGQVPVAFVTLKPKSNANAKTLQEWCKASMSVYKVPEIRILDALPLSATGKILKVDLEKML